MSNDKPAHAWAHDIVKHVADTGPDHLLAIERVPFCMCKQLALEDITRSVRCKECGRRIEAFDALKLLSADWDRYARNRSAIKNDLERLGRDRDALKREVDNLRAQRKRWSEKKR